VPVLKYPTLRASFNAASQISLRNLGLSVAQGLSSISFWVAALDRAVPARPNAQYAHAHPPGSAPQYAWVLPGIFPGTHPMAEGLRYRLGLGYHKGVQKASVCMHNAHTLPAAAGHRLNDDGITDLWAILRPSSASFKGFACQGAQALRLPGPFPGLGPYPPFCG